MTTIRLYAEVLGVLFVALGSIFGIAAAFTLIALTATGRIAL